MAQANAQNQEQRHTAVSLAVQRYFPLRRGQVWTYVERVVTPSQTLLLERQVTLTIYSQGQNEYAGRWDFQSAQSPLPNTRYRVVDDGVQQAQLTDDTAYTPYFYLLKGPLVVGTTWHTMPGSVMRLAAVDLSCVVPAGAFEGCVEVLREDDPTPESRMLTQYRFAPDTGLVWQQRRLFHRQTLQRIDTMELQKLPAPA